MALDSVPWFVGGGAQHSPEIARVLSYAAFGGVEGVLGSGDLKVTQLDTPGAGAKVAAGAASVLNRASGGAYQAYVARNPAADTTAITFAATGSGGPRSDMVVLRIEDPFLAGEPWADPVDATVGPYAFLRVISNVGPTTTTFEQLGLGQSAIPLARVDIPPSTATITDSMIVDLRQIPASVAKRQTNTFSTNGPVSPQTLTSSSYVAFPAVGSTTIAIPSWATTAVVRGYLGGAYADGTAGGASWGSVRITIGGTAVTEDTSYAQGNLSYLSTNVGGRVAIPASFRGTTKTVRWEGKKVGGSGSLRVKSDESSVGFDIEWQEQPE